MSSNKSYADAARSRGGPRTRSVRRTRGQHGSSDRGYVYYEEERSNTSNVRPSLNSGYVTGNDPTPAESQTQRPPYRGRGFMRRGGRGFPRARGSRRSFNYNRFGHQNSETSDMEVNLEDNQPLVNPKEYADVTVENTAVLKCQCISSDSIVNPLAASPICTMGEDRYDNSDEYLNCFKLSSEDGLCTKPVKLTRFCSFKNDPVKGYYELKLNNLSGPDKIKPLFHNSKDQGLRQKYTYFYDHKKFHKIMSDMDKYFGDIRDGDHSEFGSISTAECLKRTRHLPIDKFEGFTYLNIMEATIEVVKLSGDTPQDRLFNLRQMTRNVIKDIVRRKHLFCCPLCADFIAERNVFDRKSFGPHFQAAHSALEPIGMIALPTHFASRFQQAKEMSTYLEIFQILEDSNLILPPVNEARREIEVKKRLDFIPFVLTNVESTIMRRHINSEEIGSKYYFPRNYIKKAYEAAKKQHRKASESSSSEQGPSSKTFYNKLKLEIKGELDKNNKDMIAAVAKHLFEEQKKLQYNFLEQTEKLRETSKRPACLEEGEIPQKASPNRRRKTTPIPDDDVMEVDQHDMPLPPPNSYQQDDPRNIIVERDPLGLESTFPPAPLLLLKGMADAGPSEYCPTGEGNGPSEYGQLQGETGDNEYCPVLTQEENRMLNEEDQNEPRGEPSKKIDDEEL